MQLKSCTISPMATTATAEIAGIASTPVTASPGANDAVYWVGPGNVPVRHSPVA
jgi:hypothetical protein